MGSYGGFSDRCWCGGFSSRGMPYVEVYMEVCHIWRYAIYGGMPYMEVCHIWRYAIYGGTGGVAVGIAEVAHASLHLIYVICNNNKKTSMYQDQRLVYRRGCVFFFICVFFCREKNTYGISQRLRR